jgi:hypothetical protein
MRSGRHNGSTCTAVPIFIRLVRAAIAVATLSGSDNTNRVGAACSSARHMTSSPQRSAASTCSKERSNASVSLLGGAELDPMTYIQVVEQIASHDASTGWCVEQANGCSMAAAFVVPEIAHEIFGPPDGIVVWGTVG